MTEVQKLKSVTVRSICIFRKRIGSRLSSTYVDVYSDELYQLLLRNARDAREFKKNTWHLDKELAALGIFRCACFLRAYK